MVNDVTRFEMAGAKEIDEMLSKLPVAMQGKILRAINRRAAVIAKNELIRNAPPGSEIPENIEIRADKHNISGVIVRPSKKVFYARFLEYGTEVRTTEKGADRGNIPENKIPFIRRSFADATPKIIDYIVPQYGELILKELEKQNKKVQKANTKAGL